MNRVKSRGDVFVQITVRGLDHRGTNSTIGFARNRLPPGQISQRKETGRVSRQRFVVLLQNLLKDRERIVAGPQPQGTQRHDPLRRIIDATLRRVRIDRAGNIEEIPVLPLARK